MKRSLSRWAVCALFGAVALGCQEKPKLAFEEYGETTATLPFVENLPDDFPLPEAADPSTCLMREQAINSAKLERSRIEANRRDQTTQDAATAAEAR